MQPDETTYAVVGTLTKSHVDDGILYFEASKATGPDLDADGQRASMEWAIPAMRDWFATGGNLREQHDPHRAIGKALTLEDQPDGAYITGLVADPVAIQKIQTGILTDLSIGVKGHKLDFTQKSVAPGGMIVGGKVVEVSLCDRGSTPGTKLVLAKAAEADGSFVAVEEIVEKAERVEHSHSHAHADGHHRHQHNHGPDVPEHRSLDSGVSHGHQHDASDPDVVEDRAEGLSDADKSGSDKAVEPDLEKRDVPAKEREDLAGKGDALPDGSFPVKNIGDLKNAIKLAGHGKNPGKAKAFIKRRAAALGASNLIPDTWKADAPDAPEGQIHDPAELAQIREGIAQQLILEIEELIKGEDEIFDIENLAQCLSLFLSWWGHEARMGETDSPLNEDKAVTPEAGKGIELPGEILPFTPDLIKSLTADPTMVEELRKALGIDPKTESDLREEVTSLKADLEKVLSMPLPGPARARTNGQAAISSERSRLSTERDEYRRLAETIEDSQLRQGYADLAKAREADIEKLVH